MMPKWESKDIGFLLEEYLEEIKGRGYEAGLEMAQEAWNVLTPEQIEEYKGFTPEQIIELAAQSLKGKLVRRLERKLETMRKDYEGGS